MGDDEVSAFGGVDASRGGAARQIYKPIFSPGYLSAKHQKSPALR
jgi:hypothetical protein